MIQVSCAAVLSTFKTLSFRLRQELRYKQLLLVGALIICDSGFKTIRRDPLVSQEMIRS